MVRVRIAPSPTGVPHIGNTRTAFFNFLFARRNNGKFILRIDDTDKKREVAGAKEAIFEILKWLNMAADETYIQSERIDIYKKHAEMLLDKKIGYEKEGAIFVKMPKETILSWTDLIGNKKISFKSDLLQDFVILKSDGFPTYHLASVVDDKLMEISHVIRGDEWVSSTPKHLLLYGAFGWKPPYFAHLPVILGPDKTKLSKRHGAKSILDYRKEGYLKEALINFMALLGWNPSSAGNSGKDKEIMNISEIINLFDLNKVNVRSPIFDVNKLDWMNGEYIRKSQSSNLKAQIWDYLDKKYSLETIGKTIPLVQDRMKKLSDYLFLCEFFFRPPQKYAIDLKNRKEILKDIWRILDNISRWKSSVIGEEMQKLALDLGVRNSDFFMLLRVVIAGKKISPPLNESMEILGKEEVLERIKKLI